VRDANAERREIEQSWIDEAERRYDELLAGSGTSYSVEDETEAVDGPRHLRSLA
jgi:vacuolar-type H+-ATPase subunit H